ncbi:MAG: Hsp20/alpha crystallin family protein [Candidatus Brocadiaceae bacterium]|nr:Hsp20/alpha crystallin family protein [Candidatus Brocadiaceae bacterium]
MNLINWDSLNPLDNLSHIQGEMSDLFDFLSSSHPATGYVGAEFPQIVVSITKENLIVRAELPGMCSADLGVEVVDDVLTIKGERKGATDLDIAYLRRERSSGTFARSVVLPEKVDTEKVTATYKNGVLMVTLPRSPETKPKRVAIQ